MPDDEVVAEVMELGKQCAVDITGWPEDADCVRTVRMALDTIKEAIRLGKQSHNELNRVRMGA